MQTGAVTRIFTPQDQIGWISASPSGERLALVEAVCSDRTIVAGALKVVVAGETHVLDILGVDATFTAWQGEQHLLYAGHRSLESVLGVYDLAQGVAREIWRSEATTIGNARYPEAAPGAAPGVAAVMMEGFQTPATVTLIDNEQARAICTFTDERLVSMGANLGVGRPHRWTAPDGLEIHGWLVTPKGPGPFPLVMDVHGGPVWLWRPSFLARPTWMRFLLEAGYAVFRPNVRGSSGRGQAFARHVFGDMGGADTFDYLSGLDSLTAQGIADPDRLGVIGGSYGGFMSSWLITQDNRFAAAVPIAPVTDWVSEHLTCHIPHFCEMFLDDKMTNPGGKYFTRSPILFTSGVKTPTLNICGALDQNTPAVQALEFHHALLLQGVKSTLVTYPLEGHGVRNFPAFVDFSVRIMAWFEEHMPAGERPRE